jgi:tetratricopeptide (TPR) repeat protein
MKLISTTAFALVAALTASPAAAQDQKAAAQQPAQPQVKPSKQALKALVELQDAVNKNDVANIPAKIAAAQAVATTKEDRYLIAQLQLKAALAAKNNAAMASAIDAVAASGYLEPTKVSDLYVSLGSILYNDKQYAQAQAAFQKALAANSRNVDAASLLGEALFSQGQKAQAAAAFQQAVQAATAAGQKPDEKLLKRAVGVAYDAQSPTVVDLARQWVAAYPGPSSWSDAIAIYRNLNHPDIEGTLDLLRLMQATGSLNQAGEYDLFARAAIEQNNYNEAQAVLDAGIAAKAVNPTDAQTRELIAALKARPKVTAADLETAAKTTANGTTLLHIGDRYAAMGEYSKAVEVYRAAMDKPGVDKAVANLHLGMALARAGDKAGAVAALNAVTGPRADIAKFWLTYVNQKA